MRNYAHVFAIMMRLRQLCCHRELLPLDWRDVNMEDMLSITAELVAEVTHEEDPEKCKDMAIKLRDMIKEGISDDCSICLGDFNHPVITPCSHVYCRPCIVAHIETIERGATCPLCRAPISINNLLEAAPPEEDPDDTSGEDKVFDDIKIDVSSTKVNACLTELERIRQTSPTDKTIIVSQFTSFLSIIQPLLTEQGYHFCRLDGTMSMRQRSQVISDFQDTDPERPTVMLLSLRAGGVGLNLNVANHLLLMDPAWNPSTEDQCFDRIHRLGQNKPVEIIKFIMKNR